MTDRISYKLQFPIAMKLAADTAKEVRIETLSLAPRIKGVHMRATDQASGLVQGKLMVIAALAGISADEADELDQADITAIDKLYDREGSAALPLGAGDDGSTVGRGTGAPLPQT